MTTSEIMLQHAVVACLALLWLLSVAGFAIIIKVLLSHGERLDTMELRRQKTLEFFRDAMEQPAAGRKAPFVPKP
jgi:hypothetical protein